MDTRRVWLVGFGNEARPTGALAGGARLAAEKVRRAFKPCAEGAVVVLGLQASRIVNPRLVESLAFAPYVHVLVVASRDDERVRWRRAARTEVIPLTNNPSSFSVAV